MLVHLHVPVFMYVELLPAQLMATTVMKMGVLLGKPSNVVLGDKVTTLLALPVPITEML